MPASTRRTDMVKFESSRAEMDLMSQIVDRARPMLEEINGPNWYPTHEILMDLDACNSNGCPIDLERLLAFDSRDFFHDVLGIRRHINRETGQLENCFMPRCAR